MSKFKKILAIVALLVSGGQGLIHESLNNEAKANDYSFWCCTGWGWSCSATCINVPGQTQKFWGF